MKRFVSLAASVLALSVLATGADSMSTIPYSGQSLGSGLAPGFDPRGSVPDRKSKARTANPYAYGSPFSRSGNSYSNGAPYSQFERGRRNLGNSPLDPNWAVNSFDRRRYANPYPYDPIYNPYGRGLSRPYGRVVPPSYGQAAPPSGLFGPNGPFAGQEPTLGR